MVTLTPTFGERKGDMTGPAPWRPLPGVLQVLEPGLRCILAGNPSPLTGPGTNSYLIGANDLVVIDPGPDDPRHHAALLEAVPPGGAIRQIIVTHPHLDHSAGTLALARATGAPVMGFGDAYAGQSAAMQALDLTGDLGGGEGMDMAFRPDIRLGDGAVTDTAAGPVEALWTPGHAASHLCLGWRGVLFSGDLVMGWSTSLISPPDGDLAAYRASMARLAGRAGDRRYYPGHGAPVADPQARLAALVAHRAGREARVLAALGPDFASIADLTARAYDDTPPALHAAAARNLLAHLLDLTARSQAEPDRPPGFSARYRRAGP